MSNDDIYVNDGETFVDSAYYPAPPTDRVEAEVTEASIKAASYPIMGAVADWFIDAVAECDNLDNIETHAMTINGVKVGRTMSIEVQVLAYQLLKQLLMDKCTEFNQFATERD